ncbi:MAG: hypothetical protein Q8880_05870 [Bacteroidota bacterium]|nr:hypothetical protein [Bacteroidota bacterium]
MIITVWDILLTPIYLLLILYFAKRKKNKYIEQRPEYKFYIPGLLVKCIASILFCLVYVFYYGGGDTTAYYEGGNKMLNLLLQYPDRYFKIFFSKADINNMLLFDYNTGWPPQWLFVEDYALNVMKLTSLLLLPSFRNYIVTTILLAWLSYSGIWRLYLMFCELFPKLYKKFALAFLFIPSLIFWGSGLLKDPISLSAVCWFTYTLYLIFIKKEKVFFNSFRFILSLLVIILFKPYIVFSLVPGSILWISYEKIKSIKSVFIRFIYTPIIIVFAFLSFQFFISTFGNKLGKFSVDNVLERAVITQQDLAHNALYGKNSFDIGTFDPTIKGISSKAHIAIVAGIFRPYIWEARTPFSLISSLENLFFLIFTLFIIFKYGPVNIFRYISNEPLLLFSLIFSIFFAFTIGLTTANFGALVRYKIPLIPFYLSSLYILQYLHKINSVEKDKLINNDYVVMQ